MLFFFSSRRRHTRLQGDWSSDVCSSDLFDLQDSWSKGMTERPDLLQARLNVEQQGIEVKYYRNQLFPELDLIGSYGFNGASVKSDTGGQFDNTLDQIGAGQK